MSQKVRTKEETHQIASRQIYEILQANAEMYGKKLGVSFRHSGVDIYLAVNGIEHCRLHCMDLEPSVKGLEQEDTAEKSDIDETDLDFPNTTYFN